MKIVRIFYIILVLMLISQPVFAGRYSASFLKIGVGARFLGMGNSGVALSGEVSSFYWNPAGFAGINNIKTQIMYATQYGGFGTSLGSFQHAGLVIPIKAGVNIAFNWIRFAVNDIPTYPELEGRNLIHRLQNPAIRADGIPTGYIQDNENAYFISFARNNRFTLDLGWFYFKIPIEIPVGFNFKVVHINLGEENAFGLGFDLGAMLKFDLNEMLATQNFGQIGFGFVLKDLSNTKLSWSTRHHDLIEPNLTLGLSYDQKLESLKSRIKIALGFGHAGRDDWGIEWELLERIYIRAGVKSKRLTTGAGLKMSIFRVDYSLGTHDLGFSHRISVDFNLFFLKSKN